MMEIKQIGIIKSKFNESTDPFVMKKEVSTVEIDKSFEEGLYKIEMAEYIDIVFHFDRAEDYSLRGPVYDGTEKGVFASRSPKRPNAIGVSTVKLLKRDGNKLYVSGLDALNNTPVIDVKTTDSSWFSKDGKQMKDGFYKSNPRWDLAKMIKNNQLEDLMLEAAKIHGHFCPGLAMGILSGTKAMNQIMQLSDGLEDLVLITETNNCMTDGLQLVTGCSFGNNALIFKDLGKNAFSLVKRNGKGLRIIGKNNSRDFLRSKHPEFYELFQKVVVEKNHNEELALKMKKAGIEASFGLLELPFEEIFTISDVQVELPPYAPIHDSIVCEKCNELTMASRITQEHGKNVCFACAGKDFGYMDGYGIPCSK